MGDAFVVGCADGIGHGDGDLEKPLERQSLGRDEVAEHVSVDHLHGDEGNSPFLFDRINRDNVRMIERRDRLGLSLEPPETLLVREHFSGQELERHLSVQLRVLGEIHRAHPTLTEFPQHPVMEDALSDFGG